MADDENRTEAPTQRRRDEARRQGQVALSPDVAPAVVLLMAVTVAGWGVPRLFDRSALMFRAWLAAVGPLAAHDDSSWPLITRAGMQIVGVLGPFLLMMAVVGAGAIVAQIGFVVSVEQITPKLSRISPATGLKRFMSAQGAMQVGKALAKIIVLGVVGYNVLHGLLARVISTPLMELPEILAFTGTSLRRLLLWLLSTLAVLGAIDFIWQRRQHEQSLKMSRQEVKDEHKQSEGDPGVKSRFRRAARELGKRRMLTEVAKADVIITNPIHVAVALRYRAVEGLAPRVVAKGAGDMAQKIKDAARKAGVPIVERRALARALFRTVEIGQEIPPAVYRAVAEILAYIYSLRRQPSAEAR